MSISTIYLYKNDNFIIDFLENMFSVILQHYLIFNILVTDQNRLYINHLKRESLKIRQQYCKMRNALNSTRPGIQCCRIARRVDIGSAAE